MYLGNEGSGFGSKFNDVQEEDERRGFRGGGGGGFSGKVEENQVIVMVSMY